MIVVDRQLTPEEQLEISGKEVADLRQVEPSRAKSDEYLRQVLRWIDSAPEHRLNGFPYGDFFSFRGRPYWMHVRARLFYRLMYQAQTLARLPSPDFLRSVDTVFCDASAVGFWQIWTPDADLRSTGSRRPERASLSSVAMSFAGRVIPGTVRTLNLASHSWEGLVMSFAKHSIRTAAGLDDKEVGRLMDLGAGRFLRLEVQTLPRQDLEAPPEVVLEGKRAHTTLTSNDVTLAYLGLHPLEVAAVPRHFRDLKRRLRSELEWTFEFGAFDARYKEVLSREIGLLAPSITLLDTYFRTFRWFLGKAKPRFVCATGENNGVGRVLTEAARELGIPTFGIQHGVISPHNIDYRYAEGESPHNHPDHFFVWGEAPYEYLVSQSHYDPNCTHVVGQPRSDRISPKPDLEIRSFANEVGRPVILFASQPQPNTKNRADAAALLAEFCVRHRLACAVRLHPGEKDDGLYQRAFADRGAEARLRIVTGDLHDQILTSDVGATCYSTVAWEMMLMGKPVVIFDPGHADLLGLADERAVLHVPCPWDEQEAWMGALDENAQRTQALAERYIRPRDGKVAERMVEIIRRISERDAPRSITASRDQDL